MRRYELIAGAAFLICLQACGAPSGNNAAAPANGAVQANMSDAAASAGNASAPAAPAGPCPFETRNWRATLSEPVADLGGARRLTISGEQRQGSQGQYGHWREVAGAAPDEVVLEAQVESGPVSPVRHWSEISFDVTDTPSVTMAVVRCGASEITRIPIARPR